MTSNSHPQSDRADRESLSALFDGELQGDAARFALKRLGQDTQWRQACGTWQLAGDVMRGQSMAAAPSDFADRIQAALARETTAQPLVSAVANTANLISRRGWIGGAALAASVAVAALFVARPFDESASGTAEPAPRIAAAARPATPAVAVATAQEPATRAPSAPQQEIGLVAAAMAAVEVPRRASERRARGQGERAASPASSTAQTQIEMAAATPAATLIASSDAASDAAAMHPFRPSAAGIVANGLASKPWPRAVLPNYPATGAFTASYGSRAGSSNGLDDPGSPSFYPFEPRLPQGSDAAQTSRAP